MDNRSAFARARSFLNYHPAAKWSALTAAVGTAVTYVLLLMLLALFADLIVNRGEIPALGTLSDLDRQTFEEKWDKPLAHFPARTITEIAGERDLAGQEAALASAEIAWLQRLKVLGYKDANGETARKALQLRLTLSDLGLKDKADEWTERCLNSGKTLSSNESQQRLELLWRVDVHQLLTDRVGYRAGSYMASQVARTVSESSIEAALNRSVTDMGILSLVFRTQHRLDNWPIAFAAWLVPWLYEDGSVTYLTILLILALLVAIGRAACSFAAHYLAALAVVGAITRLRRAVYHHTYRLGTLAFRALGPSEAVSVSTRHLEAVHDGLLAWLTVWIREPVKFGLVLLFALLVNFWLALAFLLFAVLVWIGGGQIAAWFRSRGRAAQHQAAEQLTLIQESLSLMRLVKVYLMELFNQARVERQLAKYAETQMSRYLGEAIYRPTLVLLGMLASLVLLYVAGVVVMEGSFGVTAANAMTLAVALVSLYWPVVRWLENRRLMRRARDSAQVLFSFLDRSSSVGQAIEAEFLPPLSKVLEFDNVTLKEPGTGRKLLHGVSLTVPAGKKIALVGPDDMQKHALVYLIPRFSIRRPARFASTARICAWVTFDSLRAGIAVVLQHNLVFNDTVANNIGCGDPSFLLPKIIEAAKVAHCHKFIQDLPKGYETPIGEMGHALNTSEKFRIALARAILRDPALLIVEEPYIALDEDTKSLLDDTFSRILPGRTAIFLPHRLSTIRNCDKVYLVYEGRIEAAGDHRELVGSSELYRHLQYLEFNEFAGLVNQHVASASAVEQVG